MKELTEKVIGAAFKVHNTLGSGFLESVYNKALQVELSHINIESKRQIPLTVYYRSRVVGDFFVDLLVEECLIIEIKAVERIHPIHEVQLVNYLNAANIELGLLINFGKSVEVKRRFKGRPRI